MPTIDTRLAEFVSEELQYDTLDEQTIDRAKEFILDSIGVAMFAQQYDSTEVLTSSIQNIRENEHSGPSTIWASGRKAFTDDAAFINGSMIHTPEMDDTHRQGIIHPASSVIPSVFALCEKENANGKELIEGIVAGYEVAVRLALALPSERHPFHSTSTCGVFGATAGAAKILNLSASELEHAFGINVSQAAGSGQWIENGAWIKRIHPGMAAKDAILATSLAKNQFRGAEQPITGNSGFLNLYSDSAMPEKVIENVGTNFHINYSGIKPYGCCRYNHTPIDVTLEVISNEKLNIDDITEINLWGSAPVLHLSKPMKYKTNPRNIVEAQFSPQFAVAVALVSGNALPTEYTHEMLQNEEVKELMAKVTVHEDSDYTENHPDEMAAKIEIATPAAKYTAEQATPTGDPEHRLSKDEIVDKFKFLTTEFITTNRQNAIIDTVFSIEEIEDGAVLEQLFI